MWPNEAAALSESPGPEKRDLNQCVSFVYLLGRPGVKVALDNATGGFSSAELFWIIKNGIRMTRMASYGKVRDDSKIWSLVAFVRQMQKMTPDEYKEMEQSVASASGA